MCEENLFKSRKTKTKRFSNKQRPSIVARLGSHDSIKSKLSSNSFSMTQEPEFKKEAECHKIILSSFISECLLFLAKNLQANNPIQLYYLASCIHQQGGFRLLIALLDQDYSMINEEAKLVGKPPFEQVLPATKI